MDCIELETRADRYVDRVLSGEHESRIPKSARPPATVTPAQLKILRALSILRFSTVQHMVQLGCGHERNVQADVATLRNKKLVSWFRWTDTRNVDDDGLQTLTTTPVYCLSPKGVERCILDRVLQDDHLTLTRSWRGRPLIHSTLPHQIGVVEIALALHVASNESDTHDVKFTLPDFVSDRIDGNKKPATVENVGTKNEIRADLIAHMRAKILERSFTLYIELERRSRSEAKIRDKFEKYGVLFRAKERRFNFGAPGVLYVTTESKDEKWTKSRKELVRSWVKDSPIAPAFRIASFADVKRDPFGPIWQTATGETWAIRK